MQMAVAQTKAEIVGEARSELMKIQMMQNAQLQDSTQITNELRQRTMLIEQYADTEYKTRISQMEHQANTALLQEQAGAQKAVQDTRNYADQQWIQKEQAHNQNASNITAEARQQLAQAQDRENQLRAELERALAGGSSQVNALRQGYQMKSLRSI